ncbi:MAG: PadR family transcriptional regulator [Candidatus Acidiferrales bacterium]
MDFDRELLKGSIALLILKMLSEREMYGYEIIQEASRRSNESFQFKEGTLYPALHQLYKRGLLRSEWRIAKNGRQRKYYSITAKGRKAARERQRGWRLFIKAIDSVLANG